MLKKVRNLEKMNWAAFQRSFVTLYPGRGQVVINYEQVHPKLQNQNRGAGILPHLADFISWRAWLNFLRNESLYLSSSEISQIFPPWQRDLHGLKLDEQIHPTNYNHPRQILTGAFKGQLASWLRHWNGTRNMISALVLLLVRSPIPSSCWGIENKIIFRGARGQISSNLTSVVCL